MTTWKTYHLAHTIEEAIETLENASGSRRIIAGGTDLLLDLQQGRYSPVDLLVDVTNIPEMSALEVRGDHLFIGAARPLNEVVASPLVQQHAQALYESAGLIGGPQVRNTATLGGNVAHALPAADGAISLVALDARAEVASRAGRALHPMTEMFRGPGVSALDAQHDVLVGFHLPLRKPGQGSAFKRVMRPQGVAIAILNTAVWLERQGDRVVDVRIAVGPGGPIPLRARAAEAALCGQPLSAESIGRACEALLSEARFRTSPHRATAEYRRRIAPVLLKETLQIAYQRAQ